MQINSIETYAVSKLIEKAGDLAIAIKLWDGRLIEPKRRTPIATIVFKDKAAFYQFIYRQDIAIGEGITSGQIDIEGDWVDALLEIFRGRTRAITASPYLARLVALLSKRPRKNTIATSKSNIHQHYDIGNDFYRLWLDDNFQYTCAYFPQPDLDINSAQQNKLDYVCRKLRLKPGDRVVEAGCGWGGLARHMALHYGATVDAYNISSEQIKYARCLSEKEGYADKVRYFEDDYRNISGNYDVFVSVGMLEHVGRNNYRSLGRVIDQAVNAEARCLIHTIGRNRPAYMNGWVEKRIFPGAYPPSIKEMMEIFEPCQFSVLDVENLRMHYALTLKHWLNAFDSHKKQVIDMFDESMYRAWRLYLAGSQAAFLSGELQLFQIVFTRATNNLLPWSRDHLYDVPNRQDEEIDDGGVLHQLHL